MALVELPVLFRRGSVRRSSLAETPWAKRGDSHQIWVMCVN